MKTLIALILVAGCSAPDPTPVSLLRLDSAAASETCPAGGTTVSSGLDDNGDGTLQDGEIDDQEVVCDGAEGPEGEEGRQGEEGPEGPPGIDGEDGSLLEELTRLDDGTGPSTVEGVSTDQGFLLIYQDYERAHTAVAIGPDADSLTTVCFDCTAVPVPAGWAWRVSTANARAGLAIRWLGPVGSAPE